jgi:hypothetical protein
MYFKSKLVVAVALFFVVATSFVLSVEPFGVSSITSISNSSSTPDDPMSVPAVAGNVTELNIFGYSTTQTWQGYFGNITGTIQLADSSDNIMYNWSLADPEGEIYASRQSSVSWQNIECFNWSQNGTWLENDFNIGPEDVDGVNETFNEFSHPLFYTNNIQFDANSCMSTNIFDNSGSSNSQYYHEVLLWDGVDVVFTSIIEGEDILGFDGRDHDFQMLVLEDGHGTDTDTTPYYFYVELQ